MSTSEAIVEKLKKAEVEAAMAMAQRIAIENNTDLAGINANEDEAGTPTIATDQTKTEFRTDTERNYHRYILQVIRQCFDCRVLWSHKFVNGKLRPALIIFGERADVQIATYCFGILETTFPDYFQDWVKSVGRRLGSVGDAERHDFYRGFAAGIIGANHRVKEKTKQEMGDKYALVLVNKDAIVKAEFQKAFPSTRVKRQSFQGGGYHEASAAGHAAGRSIKLAAGAIL